MSSFYRCFLGLFLLFWFGLSESAETVLYQLPAATSPTRSNSVGTIDLTDYMRLDLSVTIKAWPSGWANIIHVGNENMMRLPGVWIRPSSATGDGFHISAATTVDQNPTVNVGGSLSLNTQYNLVIEWTQHSLLITIDGAEIHRDDAYDPHNIELAQAVYVSDPWSNAAAVTILNFAITAIYDSDVYCSDNAPVYADAFDGKKWTKDGFYDGKPYYFNGASDNMYYHSNGKWTIQDASQGPGADGYEWGCTADNPSSNNAECQSTNLVMLESLCDYCYTSADVPAPAPVPPFSSSVDDRDRDRDRVRDGAELRVEPPTPRVQPPAQPLPREWPAAWQIPVRMDSVNVNVYVALLAALLTLMTTLAVQQCMRSKKNHKLVYNAVARDSTATEVDMGTDDQQ